MKLRYLLSSTLTVLLMLSCSSSAARPDSNGAVSEPSGGAPVTTETDYPAPAVNYDAQRAKELCELYNAGTLSHENYAEMLSLAEAAYTYRFAALDDLIEKSTDADIYRNGYMALMGTIDEKYPYNQQLINICVESTDQQLGEANTKKLKELKDKMLGLYESLSSKLQAKFNDSSLSI
ncbi:MAG: hypothetical protein NC217_02655 [Muribaculaceae bacterium]|nr:hypothetical protein [Muribaculaceae bacterium]